MGDVDDVRLVEHRDRRGLADDVDQRLEVRPGERGQLEAREVRAPELEDARAELEEPRVHPDVAEVDEREQEPPGGRAGEAGGGGDLAQRQRPALAVEGADDCEPPLERLDEIGLAVGRLRGHRGARAHAVPGFVRSTSRTAASSSAVGGGVVPSVSAARSSQPVAARTCSKVTPGWTCVSTSSHVVAGRDRAHRGR